MASLVRKRRSFLPSGWGPHPVVLVFGSGAASRAARGSEGSPWVVDGGRSRVYLLHSTV